MDKKALLDRPLKAKHTSVVIPQKHPSINSVPSQYFQQDNDGKSLDQTGFKTHGLFAFAFPFEEWANYRFVDIKPVPPWNRVDEKQIRMEFPRSLTRVYFYSGSTHTDSTWLLVGQMTNSYGQIKYVFFHAWCDYTGFECQSGMNLYVADSLKDLVQFGLSTEQRDQFYCFQTLQPIKKKLPWER